MYFRLDFTPLWYILETWTSSCQPPEGYECLVCDQQYLVLRYWNEKLKTQFARHKKIKLDESSSKSSFWFRSSEDITFNLYIRNKNVNWLSDHPIGHILVGDIFCHHHYATDGVYLWPGLLVHSFEPSHYKLTLITVFEAHSKVCISHRFNFAADPFSQRC